MPSSSARCSQLPRAVDKVPFYVALKKLRDYLRGDLPSLDDSEVMFPDLELKVEPRKDRLELKMKMEYDIKTEPMLNLSAHEPCVSSEPKAKLTRGAKQLKNETIVSDCVTPSQDMPTSIPQWEFHSRQRDWDHIPNHLQLPPMLPSSGSIPFLVKEEQVQDLTQYGSMPTVTVSESIFSGWNRSMPFVNSNLPPYSADSQATFHTFPVHSTRSTIPTSNSTSMNSEVYQPLNLTSNKTH